MAAVSQRPADAVRRLADHRRGGWHRGVLFRVRTVAHERTAYRTIDRTLYLGRAHDALDGGDQFPGACVHRLADAVRQTRRLADIRTYPVRLDRLRMQDRA